MPTSHSSATDDRRSTSYVGACLWDLSCTCKERAAAETPSPSRGFLYGGQLVAGGSHGVQASGNFRGHSPRVEAPTAQRDASHGFERDTVLRGTRKPLFEKVIREEKLKMDSKTQVLDLDMDVLILCASRLGLRDLVNMALACRKFREAAYSDTVWQIQCRKRWPAKLIFRGQDMNSAGREAYVARHRATHQFRLMDPVDWQVQISTSPVSHLVLEDDRVTIAQGQNMSVWKLGPGDSAPSMVGYLRDHNARITCMRAFPFLGLATFQSSSRREDSLLVSSSCDHTIRLWGTGRNIQTFRGHTGPVSTLADKLLGDDTVLASGGLDGTIRLWALSSTSNRRRSPLLATLHSHENFVRELAVAGHNTSLLVSAGKDLKVRVWDTTAVSLSATASCVGSMRSPGLPAALRCDGTVCYVVGGSTAAVIDLRTMRLVATVATHDSGVVSFAIGPSKSLICTGGNDGTAKLWDVRKMENHPGPLAVFSKHTGPVSSVYLDSYKVVTGGQEDSNVRVWDVSTGHALNTLETVDDQHLYGRVGVSAIAVRGTQLVTGSCLAAAGVVRIRNFSNGTALRDADFGGHSSGDTQPMYSCGHSALARGVPVVCFSQRSKFVSAGSDVTEMGMMISGSWIEVVEGGYDDFSYLYTENCECVVLKDEAAVVCWSSN